MQKEISFTKTYENQRQKENREIKELINAGCEIKYFKGWIMVGGKTFNGYNKMIIERLMKESVGER